MDTLAARAAAARIARLTAWVLRRADRVVEVLIVALFGAIVVVGGLQVFCRYALNASLGWSEEFQRYGLIWIVFLSLVVGYRCKAHLGMEFLLLKMPAMLRTSMAWFTDLLWLALGLAMVLFTVVYRTPAGMTFLASVGRQSSAGMGLRMDWVYACIVVSGAYLTLAAFHSLITRAGGELAVSAPGGGRQC